MSTMVSATNFYKSPSRYLRGDELVTIEDTKSHKLKSILIPEKLVEKYRFILDHELDASIKKSFELPMPAEIPDAFVSDVEKVG